MNVTNVKSNSNRVLFFLLFGITLTVFIFTTDAHRYSMDEDIPQQLAIHILTGKPDPQFVQGQSKMEFNYESLRPWLGGPPCQNGILCYPADMGYALTEIPFISVNHYLHVIDKNTVIWSVSDFDDPYYVSFRNSIDPDFTFLELFYGPLISALSVSTFFLICRSFNYSPKNSVMLSFIFGLTTTVWAYSKTSLNAVPEVLFILLGFLLFKKFQKNGSITNILLCTSSLGFAFLVRHDAYIFILVLFSFFLFEIRKQNKRIIKIISFILPPFLSYLIHAWIDQLRFGQDSTAVSSAVASAVSPLTFSLNSLMPIFGLLLSPGVGLLIFAPMLFTIFFSFRDFFMRNKHDCIFFLGLIGLFLIVYSGYVTAWHGLVSWGARYLLPIIPFMILPLGASLEKRKSKSFYLILIVLGSIGVFINMIYMVQDVSWFVWSRPTSDHGLYSIAKPTDPLYLSPAVIWSFEYSQLTQSAITAFTHLQTDIFLLKLMGQMFYGLSLIIILISLSYLLFRTLKLQQIDSVKK